MNAVAKTFDPYKVLGVAKDATLAAIKTAYRECAKAYHPDAGGDPAHWEDVQKAYDTLRDPKRRKSYDDTGAIEDVKPDNDRASALQVIEMHLVPMLDAYLTAREDTKSFFDPRKKNLTYAISMKIRDELINLNKSIAPGEDVLAFWDDMKTRFVIREGSTEGDNLFVRRIEAQRSHTQEQIANIRLQIRVREVALTILDSYEFKFDAPAPVVVNVGDLNASTGYLWPQGS